MIDEQYCLHCTEKRTKIFSEYRKTKRIYRDEKGAEWSGNRCPECYAKYKKQYDAKRRLKKGFIPLGTIRVCETCSYQFTVEKGSSNLYCSKCRWESKE
jgi:hypothetical protein